MIILALALVLVVGVIAQTNETAGNENANSLNEKTAEAVAENIISNNDLSNDTQKFIKDFVKKENINEEQIGFIGKIDLNNPPEEVKLGDKIADTNIAIYEVNYTKENENKKIFVVAYSSGEFKVPLELRPATAIEYLSFGETMETSGSLYLKTNTGVRSSEEKGYVMMDSGSITGISTNIEAVSGTGRINIIVYINGKDVGLRNQIYVDSAGVMKDYDKQSKDIVLFQPGDIISVYVETQGDVAWKDAINLVKIELEE